MSAPTTELESLYREVGPGVLRYLEQRVGHADAEELLQETFLAVARDWRRVEQADSRRAWIFGIAHNLLRNDARRRRRQDVPLEQEPEAPNARAGPDSTEEVLAAIGRLSPAQRDVLELRIAHDLGYAQIAETLGIPIGTVRSRLHHAVRQLRRQLEGESGAAASPPHTRVSRTDAGESGHGR